MCDSDIFIFIMFIKVILCASEHICSIVRYCFRSFKQLVNVLVLIDTDQSIFVNGRFSLPSDIHRTNNLCITPLIFEHRKFSGNSFNFGNFRFLKTLPVFKKCTNGYIWSLYVHYVYLLIY